MFFLKCFGWVLLSVFGGFEGSFFLLLLFLDGFAGIWGGSNVGFSAQDEPTKGL